MNLSSTSFFFFLKRPHGSRKYYFYQIFFDSVSLRGTFKSKISKNVIFLHFFSDVSTFIQIVKMFLLKLKVLVVAIIFAKLYDIWRFFTHWKQLLNLLGWFQKVIWSFKFWSLKYVPTSSFRLGNKIILKFQNTCSSVRQVLICPFNCYMQSLWLLD